MAQEIMDAYKVAVEDTSQLSSRRQAIDNLYLSVVTLALAAEGIVAASSPLDNWLPVIVVIGISIFGIAFTLHWRRVITNLKNVLRIRYDFLRDLESHPVLAAAQAQVFTEEWTRLYKGAKRKRSFTAATRSLQFLFITIFAVLPLILGGLTVLASDPAFHNLIKPLHLTAP